MTQEEKQLLLKDLCARLPYGVKVDISGKTEDLLGILNDIASVGYDINDFDDVAAEDIKPYLRPMSSLTVEEKEELSAEQAKDEGIFLNIINHSQMGDDSLLGTGIPHYAEDWANKNHFDYRGLIPMGLALEAPKDMYKTE